MMDWDAVIERYSGVMKRVLAMLVAMAERGAVKLGAGGLGAGKLSAGGQFTFFPPKGAAVQNEAQAEKSKLSPAFTPPAPGLTLPRHLHRALLKLLYPAEAAMRRLIIVASRGLMVTLPAPREAPAVPKRPRRPFLPVVPQPPQSRAGCVTALPLVDPLRPWNVRPWRPIPVGVPRISVPGFTEPFAIIIRRRDDPVDATRIALRLQALAAVLDDLPRHARRFARWQARGKDAVARDRAAEAADAQSGRSGRKALFRRTWPLKPGWPPGWRRKPVHEVHEVLNDIHRLALWTLECPNTS